MSVRSPRISRVEIGAATGPTEETKPDSRPAKKEMLEREADVRNDVRDSRPDESECSRGKRK